MHGHWCVVGLSVLAHMHTPPRSSFTLTWAGRGDDPIFFFIFGTHTKNGKSGLTFMILPVLEFFLTQVLVWFSSPHAGSHVLPSTIFTVGKFPSHQESVCVCILSRLGRGSPLRRRRISGCLSPTIWVVVGCVGSFGHDRAINDLGVNFLVWAMH